MTSAGESRPSSFLEVPPDFFDGARVVFCEDEEGCLPSLVAAASGSPLLEVSSSQPDSVPQSSLNRWACNTCSHLEFSSLDEQRSHFKSDFHRFNVKRKLIGKAPISEEGFEVLAQGQQQKDDDVSSISGSDEDDSDSSDEGELSYHKSSSASKIQNYVSIMLPSFDEIARFWKCVVSRDSERLSKHEGLLGRDLVSEEELLQRLKKFISREVPEENSLWVVLLLRGGHFAGCIIDCKKGSILAHKTYHRYVVRAKAGGKQSTKDGSGRAPKSAGATLRRHNEASLHREIRELLASWKCNLEAASCLFVHAPSKNSHVLYGGDDAPLNRNDKRVRSVPFTTQRPTFKEAKRVFNELISITYKKKESFDAANSESSLNQSSKKLPEGLTVANARIENLIEGVKGTLSSDDNLREGSSTQSENVPVDEKVEILMTPLHNAAQLGQSDLVLELLEKGANPCAKDHRGRTPYSLAINKETRNMFRRFMAANLDLWDWHAANVPSALTDEMEAAQVAKQVEKDAKRKAKAKEQKKMRKEKLKAREMAAAAISEKIASESTTSSTHNSSSVMAQDAKKNAEAIEREKRALAAERRIMGLSLGADASSNGCPSSLIKKDGPCCSYCGVSLAGMTPFYRLSFQYCTTACVHTHRVTLECQ